MLVMSVRLVTSNRQRRCFSPRADRLGHAIALPTPPATCGPRCQGYKPEEIVAKLRQVDVLTSQGQSTPERSVRSA